jgi:hypothetical protein
MQVHPDWSQTNCSAQTIEAELGITFKGPGLYLTKTDTLLIKKHGSGTGHFSIYVWNAPLGKTILGQAASIPVQLDER